MCHALCDLSVDPESPPGLCDFEICGVHPGETGDEVCQEATDLEGEPMQWSDIGVGICMAP